MVYFHPGGFYGGTGHLKVFGPQYIMDQDIVLVTNNYRLGALGE
jgi:carboxylesterase type B